MLPLALLPCILNHTLHPPAVGNTSCYRMDLVPDILKYTFIKEECAGGALTADRRNALTTTQSRAESDRQTDSRQGASRSYGCDVNRLQSSRGQLPFHFSSAYWGVGGAQRTTSRTPRLCPRALESTSAPGTARAGAAHLRTASSRASPNFRVTAAQKPYRKP